TAYEQMDALITSQRLGLPTPNGYSSHAPTGWEAPWHYYQLDWWAANIRERFGEENLQRNAYYARHGFHNPAIAGRLAGAPGEPIRTFLGKSLPPEGFQARIEVQQIGGQFLPKQHTRLAVELTNTSSAFWPALGFADGGCFINLTYRWFDTRGKEVVTEAHNRFPIPHDLKPGRSAILYPQALAPEQPGLSTLELDLLEDPTSRFSDRGSLPWRQQVEVAGR